LMLDVSIEKAVSSFMDFASLLVEFL
jgi:hypothetical protein